VSEATLHAVAGPGGIAEAAQPAATHAALVGPFERLVTRVSAPGDVLEEAARGLPEGAATAEAIAVRLRRRGFPLRWGEPDTISPPRALLELCRARGRASVELWRADPSLLTELQLGAWSQASLAHRLARRIPLRALHPGRLLRLAAEREFWRGVREVASAAERRRLTACYTALVYHRLAGEGKPGQAWIDLHPRRFARQLQLLRRLGFRPLSAERLLAFHTDGELPRRAFVVTVDDGTADCRAPLLGHAAFAPQLFVCTGSVGGAATWLDGEPLLSWEELRVIAREGIAVGGHGRTHRPLDGLEDAELESEVAGSLFDLVERLGDPLRVLAYPNGRHDHAVRAAAISAGYRAAWTTVKGRNGLGTDPWCLRRISIHAADGPLAALWKVVTGEPPPWRRA
jgi:peptidoglycan/xylan/chitin deacetylase (PgdA/CDA1 family)